MMGSRLAHYCVVGFGTPFTPLRVRGCGLRHGHRGLFLGEEGFLAIHEVAGIECGQFEAVSMGDGVSGASFDAVSAEDTAVVIDVIDLGVTFRAADAVLSRVLRR